MPFQRPRIARFCRNHHQIARIAENVVNFRVGAIICRKRLAFALLCVIIRRPVRAYNQIGLKLVHVLNAALLRAGLPYGHNRIHRPARAEHVHSQHGHIPVKRAFVVLYHLRLKAVLQIGKLFIAAFGKKARAHALDPIAVQPLKLVGYAFKRHYMPEARFGKWKYNSRLVHKNSVIVYL